MKLNKLPKGKTTVLKAEYGVEITHSQSIRQNVAYQSAEFHYGVKLHCADDPESITKAIRRAERIVERAALPKFHEQAKILNQMAKGKQ